MYRVCCLEHHTVLALKLNGGGNKTPRVHFKEYIFRDLEFQEMFEKLGEAGCAGRRGLAGSGKEEKMASENFKSVMRKLLE